MKRPLSFYTRQLFLGSSLISFALFLSVGNLLRLVSSSLFSDSLSFSEGLFYLCSFSSAFFLSAFHKLFRYFIYFFAGFGLSFLYGVYLHGWDLHAGLYALRFTLLFCSCFIMAELCFEFFAGSLHTFFIFLYRIYAASLILGFILYVFFPASEELWRVLDEYHVGFQGDPHIGRFVSVYFDPNYYCSIAPIGFLVSYYLYESTRKKRYGFFALLSFLSALLSWSRSGLFVFGALFLYRVCYSLFSWRPQVFRKNSLSFLCGALLFCSIGFYLYAEELMVFWDRTLHFFEEESALCRLRTFQFGLELLAQYPLWGMGTNFLYSHTIEGIGLNSLDSSLLALLVQIGVVPFLMLALCALYKIPHLHMVDSMWREKEKKMPYFFSWFALYGVLILLFASQFNNLLFYPFWVLPYSVTFLFLLKAAKKPHLLEEDGAENQDKILCVRTCE
jgi:hypothetical protein